MSETKQKFSSGAELRGIILLLVALLVPLGASRTHAQSDEVPQRASQLGESGKGGHTDSEATPCDVYRSYLKAVKTNDLAGAKQCWCMRGNDSAGALDVIAGLYTAFHRFNAAMKRFGEDGRFGIVIVIRWDSRRLSDNHLGLRAGPGRCGCGQRSRQHRRCRLWQSFERYIAVRKVREIRGRGRLRPGSRAASEEAEGAS